MPELVRGCLRVLTCLTIQRDRLEPDSTTMRLAGRREPGPWRLPDPDRSGMSRNPTPHLSDEQILLTYCTFNGFLLGHLLPEPAPSRRAVMAASRPGGGVAGTGAAVMAGRPACVFDQCVV